MNNKFLKYLFHVVKPQFEHKKIWFHIYNIILRHFLGKSTILATQATSSSAKWTLLLHIIILLTIELSFVRYLLKTKLVIFFSLVFLFTPYTSLSSQGALESLDGFQLYIPRCYKPLSTGGNLISRRYALLWRRLCLQQ